MQNSAEARAPLFSNGMSAPPVCQHSRNWRISTRVDPPSQPGEANGSRKITAMVTSPAFGLHSTTVVHEGAPRILLTGYRFPAYGVNGCHRLSLSCRFGLSRASKRRTLNYQRPYQLDLGARPI